MTSAEIDLINEIKKYREQIDKTSSIYRKNDLYKHLIYLKKELRTYIKFRYGDKNGR